VAAFTEVRAAGTIALASFSTNFFSSSPRLLMFGTSSADARASGTSSAARARIDA
jgi:hypothetical protein